MEETVENKNTEEVENSEPLPLSEVDELKQKLEALTKEVETYKDSWQRERAEFQNYKKRSASESLILRKESVKSFILQLLDPIDNLEMVSKTNTENQELKVFISGVDMVRKMFISAIEKEGIRRSEPINEPFDPLMMEAIASEDREGLTEDTVIEVYQAGYYFQNNEEKTSIRPSRVKVGKPK
jgi:molecular chaperone GrpE